MFFDNLGQILVKFGIIPEKLMASDGLNEEEMNNNVDKLASFETIAKIYKSGNYFYLQNNIDAVASILAKGKSVIIGVGFGNGEWNMEVPIIKETDVNYRHAIVALPYSFFNYQGKKSILIQDSWGINSGIKGRRIITEDWFNEKRIFTAMWFEDISNLSLLNSQIEKPKYKFTRILTTGMRGYDIAMLQRCLGYLKDKDGYLFPLITETTGYYGGITRKAVERYQQMLLLPITGVVDDETIIELNKDFK